MAGVTRFYNFSTRDATGGLLKIMGRDILRFMWWGKDRWYVQVLGCRTISFRKK